MRASEPGMQMTESHSTVAFLIGGDQFQPDQVFNHPHRNVIYRSMGQKNSIRVKPIVERNKLGDLLVGSSNSLREMVRKPADLGKMILKADKHHQLIQSLIDKANRPGEVANIPLEVVKAS